MESLERDTLLQRDHVYSGRIVELIVDTIQIKGQETLREVIRHPGGVVVLAEIEKDRIVFVRQHRYPIDRNLLELPAGKLEPGEDPLDHAARELEEETGFRPRSLEHVCSFYSSPGYCDEIIHLYYTSQVERTAPNRAFDEEIILEFLGLDQAVTQVLNGDITDCKSLVAVLWLLRERQLDPQKRTVKLA